MRLYDVNVVAVIASFVCVLIAGCVDKPNYSNTNTGDRLINRGPCEEIDWGYVEDYGEAMTEYLNCIYGYPEGWVGCYRGSFIDQVDVLCLHVNCIVTSPQNLDGVLQQFKAFIEGTTICRPTEECENGHYEFNFVYVIQTGCGLPWFEFSLYAVHSCCSGQYEHAFCCESP
jgi:hypothetical protein